MKNVSEKTKDLTLLGDNDADFKGLETFKAAKNINNIVLTSDELTSFCPVTEQPDFSNIIIDYIPNGKVIETKSLKLYLESYRGITMFCEDISSKVCQDVFDACEPDVCKITVIQNKRGGIVTTAISELRNDNG